MSTPSAEPRNSRKGLPLWAILALSLSIVRLTRRAGRGSVTASAGPLPGVEYATEPASEVERE